MSELEASLSTMVDKLTNAADIISSKMVDVAPEAYETIVDIVFAKGMFDICVAAVFFFSSVGVSIKLFEYVNASVIKYDEAPYDKMDETLPPKIGLSIAGIIITVIFIIGAMCELVSFHNWLAVINPDAALAYKALLSAGIGI